MIHNRHLLRLTILLCLLFAASCGRVANGLPLTIPSISPSIVKTAATLPANTQHPSLPATPAQTDTLRPTRTDTPLLPSPTLPVTPTWTPTPTQFVDTYPHKQVWLSYAYSSGDHFPYEEYLGSDNFPTMVLYTDGQLIVRHYRLPIQTKMLSPDEICNLFITLESMGLSQIKTNGTGGLDDPIYQNTKGLGKVFDAGGTLLFISGSVPRFYYVYDPYKDRAVKQIINIFAFLEHYTPNNLQRYHADRLSVYVQEGRDAYFRFRPYTKPVKTIPWPASAAPLSQNDNGKCSWKGKPLPMYLI